MAEPLIDWYSLESHVFINPRLPEGHRKQLYAAAHPHNHLEGHIWLASSGTENFPKMIALSKKSMLLSAAAVNEHLQVQKKDPWLNVLPLFHAGGLGIYARAQLTESPVVDLSAQKWDARQYVNILVDFGICFSALTPTHVYDLISQKISAPKGLKAIIVGGGPLPEKLHAEAFALGWPLRKSYGMTEMCSQVATAVQHHPGAVLVPLKHVSLRFNASDYIEIYSLALLTGYVHGDDPHTRFIDPKVGGWYTTQDKGKMQGGILQIFGRGADFIKIGGESVSVSELEAVWENIRIKNLCLQDMVLIDLPDERLGRIICLAVAASEASLNLEPLLEEFHRRVIPLAKIRQVFYLDALPRTDLHKLKKNELRDIIKQRMS